MIKSVNNNIENSNKANLDFGEKASFKSFSCLVEKRMYWKSFMHNETNLSERTVDFRGLRLLAIVTILFCCVALAGIWKFILQPGTIGHNWDWSIPPLAEQLRYMSQQSFHIWGGTFGNPIGSQLNFSILIFFLGSFGYLGLSGAFVSKFLLFFTILISGISMFYLVHSILTDENKQTDNFTVFFSSFIAGFFYALSPFIFSEFIGGAITQFLAYSLIPASLYFYRKMKFHKEFRFIFAFTIILSLISVSFNELPLVLLIIALYTIFLGNRQMAKGLIIAFLIYIPLNLYWIIPTLSELAQGTSSLSLSLSNGLYLPTLSNAVPTMSQIFVGLGYARPFSLWILDETILPIWAIVTFSFLILILICLLLFRKTKEAFFWIALYTLSLAISTVGNSPISGAIIWLYQNVSLMTLYRSPQHLIVLTILPLAILVGLGSFAIISLSKKKIKKLVHIKHRKILTVAVFILIILSATIWISPFLTGNLGADYLKSKGGGNFVDTFSLSPDLVTALGIINNGSDSYRTLFLPPANSPYYLETEYQQEGQGGDVVVGCTPQGIGDSSNSYTNWLVASISNSFENGTFDNPQLLQIANVKYIVLRNDVIPNFGEYANQWNATKVQSILGLIDGLKLIYTGPYVSLWEYENPYPIVYAGENSTSINLNTSIFTPLSEPVISFQQVDSTTYHVSVANATEPFYLVFSQTYSPSWQLYVGSVNWFNTLTNKPFSAKHLLVNTYANAWYINKTGTFTVTLHYSPQNTFYLSSIVSILTFTGCIAISIYSYIKLKRQKSKLKTII